MKKEKKVKPERRSIKNYIKDNMDLLEELEACNYERNKDFHIRDQMMLDIENLTAQLEEERHLLSYKMLFWLVMILNAVVVYLWYWSTNA